MAWMLAVLVSLAQAESAGVLPRGEVVAYGGAGLGTFRYGSSGELRDRQLRFRLDAYAAVGLGRLVMVATSVPLEHNRVLDLPGTPPAPCATDACASTTSAGDLSLGVRVGLGPSAERLAVGLAAHTDAWNAGTRGRWTNAGQGATGLVAECIGSVPMGSAEILGWGRYDLVFGTPVLVDSEVERLPTDAAGGGVQVGRPLGPVRGELSATGWTRLGGADFGPEWSAAYPREWAWSGLRYRELRGQAKLSVPLGVAAGLHVYASRVAWVRNGPKDAWDMGIGVHRSFPPARSSLR